MYKVTSYTCTYSSGTSSSIQQDALRSSRVVVNVRGDVIHLHVKQRHSKDRKRISLNPNSADNWHSVPEVASYTCT
jgi:hypothetical protein